MEKDKQRVLGWSVVAAIWIAALALVGGFVVHRHGERPQPTQTRIRIVKEARVAADIRGRMREQAELYGHSEGRPVPGQPE